MIVYGGDQRGPIWRDRRCGNLTGSRAPVVVSQPRLLWDTQTKGRRDYLHQLAREQLTGIPEEPCRWPTRAMRRGAAMEAEARLAYADYLGSAVDTSMFVAHDHLRAGASLDGHVKDFEGIVEIKCPNTATHHLYHALGRVPPKYRAQITHALWLTGAAWCDFVSYDDRARLVAPLFVVRVYRDELDIAAYGRAVERFLAELDAIVAPLASMSAVQFFATAPLEVAGPILGQCLTVVSRRRRERAA